MARPRKAPDQQRRHVVNIRLTDAELLQLKEAAAAAGMPYGRYARDTVLGNRPRSKPAITRLFKDLLYELSSISTNFSQLADATGDDRYQEWARYVGGRLPEHLMGRKDLAPLIEEQLDQINAAGQMVNALARRANSGKEIEREERLEVIRAVRLVLEPIHEAIEEAIETPPDGPADAATAKPSAKAPASPSNNKNNKKRTARPKAQRKR